MASKTLQSFAESRAERTLSFASAAFLESESFILIPLITTARAETTGDDVAADGSTKISNYGHALAVSGNQHAATLTGSPCFLILIPFLRFFTPPASVCIDWEKRTTVGPGSRQATGGVPEQESGPLSEQAREQARVVGNGGATAKAGPLATGSPLTAASQWQFPRRPAEMIRNNSARTSITAPCDVCSRSGAHRFLILQLS